MPQFDDDKIRVQQATDLVRLIGEQVALRPKGREFVGLCPFHDDKKPSMFVSPQKQIFKCFSCGAGGDVFSFTMDYHKMSFREALEHLAQRAGIELKPTRGGPRDAGGRSERQRIAEANDKAMRFFRHVLKHDQHGRVGRDYLATRGVSDEMAEAFELGLAPDRWDGLAMKVQHDRWPADDFELAGLLSRRRSGQGLVDRFRHRLIFPIHDSLGRPIAFGGRVLPDAQQTADDPTRDAKYLNSAESPLFDKSATLYGLHLAKKPIIDSKTAVIVEGYTDVIACHQAGFRNVVATLGTSLTQGHARELRRYAEKVVLVFDADEAGQKAADRAVEVFLTGELDVWIVVLDEGQDPADLMRAEGGPQRWETALAEAADALSYRMSRLKSSLDAAETLTARQHRIEAAIDDLVRLGLGTTGPVRRSLVLRRLAEVVDVKEGVLTGLFESRRKAGSRRGPTTPAGDPESAPESAERVAAPEDGHRLLWVRRAEREFLACLIQDAGLFDRRLPDGQSIDEEIGPADLCWPEHRRVYQLMYDRLIDCEPLPLAALVAELTEAGDTVAVRALTTADREVESAVAGQADRRAELFDAAVAALRRYRHEREFEEQKRSLLDTASPETDAVTRAQAAMRLLESRRTQAHANRIPSVAP